MPGQRPTRIEVLDGKHPGLRELVDKRLAAYVKEEEIRAELKRVYGEEVSQKTISNYRVRRWRPENEQALERKAWALVSLEIQREHPGIDVGELSRIVKLLAEAHIGRPVSILELLKEQRHQEMLKLERKKVEIFEKHLELLRLRRIS